MSKPGKDHKRMWFVESYKEVPADIRLVPVRDCAQYYSKPRLARYAGLMWIDEFAERFHDDRESAAAYWRTMKIKALERMGREIVSLAKAEPKFKEPK